MTKLERVCELLDNQEIDKATELLHEVFVEKSRSIYQQIVESEDFGMEEDFDLEEDELEEDELEENFGGSPNQQFINEITDDEEEIENDEYSDDESDEGDEEDDFGDEDDDDFGDEEDDFGDEEGGEGSDEERIEDLEVALADLRAEFDELMSQELEEPQHADLAGDEGEFGGDEDEFGGEEDEFEEEYHFENNIPESTQRRKKRIKEATKLQDQVADPGMKQEGKFSGTGKNSKAGSIDKESPFTHAPSKENYGGNPTKFGDNAGSDGKALDKSSKKDNGFGAGTNINVKQGNVSDPGMSQEGKFSGTGKNSKAGSTSKESPLTKAPRRRG